ncbi:MAG: N-acetylgalactosamine-6-sulfatase [Rhodopirellula sp.]|nr:N-acetylgalactosamine-6-sulfatase [Rhodopirellula sp.]
MNFRVATVLLASVYLGTFLVSNESYAEKPNIVVIMADDLGYGDLQCYGHPRVKTPNIDQLARDGVRFTQHYANGPECSPTRTAFLTGKYQQFAGGLECAIGTGNVGRYDDAIRLANQHDLGLPADQTVLPNLVTQQGYRSAVFGKWHLGYEPKFNPKTHGWHEFFGYLGGNVHYFNHRETSDLHVLFSDDLPIYRDGYMTDLITESSVKFIEKTKEPYLLFISHESPHFPFQGPSDTAKNVTSENWMDLDQDAYVAMIESLDSSVGQIVNAVEQAGQRDNTAIVFVSDNGGFANAANMGSLRGAKSTTFEGGIRVPLIISWPAKIQSGQTCDQVCITFDLTKSILNLAGAENQPEQLDGYDIISHLVERKPNSPRTLFWRGKRGERVWKAVRHGDQKLVIKTGEPDQIKSVFDLSVDPAEQHDLKATHPKLTLQLMDLLQSWESSLKPQR